MSDPILLSTAYFAPIEYFSRITRAGSILLESQENYVKQTYRNRCCILSSNGPQTLSVPVLLGSFHKTAIKEIKIDNSKRWQQVHKRAIVSAYNNSPFFQFYYSEIEGVIDSNYAFLIDLNRASLEVMLKYLRIEKTIVYTDKFLQPTGDTFDYRYKISPKIPSTYSYKKYTHVFPSVEQVKGLSILDLLFNNGPDSSKMLSE